MRKSVVDHGGMLALFDAFLQIIMRRRGPEDLPDSQLLLSLSFAAYLLAQVPTAAIIYGWTGLAMFAILADGALISGYLWALLKLTGRASRFRQTLTAILGTGALLALPQAPLAYLSKAATVAGQSNLGPGLGLLALFAWTLMVQGHIAARALSSHIGIGLLVALGYFLLSFQLSGVIAPPAAG